MPLVRQSLTWQTQICRFAYFNRRRRRRRRDLPTNLCANLFQRLTQQETSQELIWRAFTLPSRIHRQTRSLVGHCGFSSQPSCTLGKKRNIKYTSYIQFYSPLSSPYSPRLAGQTINFIGLRNARHSTLSESRLFRVRLPSALAIDQVQWLGWELNSKGKFVPKMAAMGASMDPEKLAETSTNLNLKLMKWRLMPDLNLDAISEKKCLLFGAGTLGCGVARNLLSWGVRNLTFVDSGKVSYSNPVRQNLFRHEDALNGGQKAETAAKRILEICPSANAKGVSLHIPMPGHNVSESLLAECEEQFNSIEALVKDHDVLFLLTDSRESRWLPTMLGAAHGKLVMNSALGFDSYLVMRHGVRGSANKEPEAIQAEGFKCITGNQLGCYFCNDIVAPGNVSRPFIWLDRGIGLGLH